MFPSCMIRAATCGPFFTLILLALLLASDAMAAGFSVSPTRIELTAEDRVMALTLTNSRNREASIQLEIKQWSQLHGEDVYESTTELLATPPIFTLAAGEQQIVRIGLRRPPDPDTELSYRLFLQELQPPTPEGFQGLQMVLRMGVPVFVAPAGAAPRHDLDWQADRIEDNQLRLRVENRGTGYAQVTSMALEAGEARLEPGGMLYVLPGATRHWVLDGGAALTPGTLLELSARINGVVTSLDLPVR